MKLQQHKGVKLTAMIFQEKSGAVVFGQQEVQNEFFKSCNKLKHLISYFLFLFFINLQ